ncbi:GNAT family N-acetyltransferase [Pisciglobus halotolerans]|uniref:Ribosomal-protein-alanine N-acetyltransferase n=1 Tax=Pisciglobus halotolerans TaxID=745365 RepID=A0A1I3ARB7_9LACT|nr:GNAT family protein [Pisciglobus halotolerans]SFH52269.1 ribosomal-protein-alanine N-acetyltransferase [Pisciglobus halotolerans]
MNHTALKFSTYQQIEGERILLRPVKLADAEDMFEYASNEETTRFVFEAHKNLEETKESIASFFLKSPFGKYAIVLKQTNKMIGTIDLRTEEEHKKGELGYTLHQNYQGHGYMTEAGYLILDFGFQILELERIAAFHDARNPASGKVMQRLGMKYEGTLRKNRVHKGQSVDDICYAILKEEYKKRFDSITKKM